MAAIFGILGACRKDELIHVSVNDIQKYYSDAGQEKISPMILLKIPNIKNDVERSVTVKDQFYKIYEKYANLRPQNVPHSRFCGNYQNGKCTQQPIGIHKFGSMPKMIATKLNSDNPELYTGHCFRHTSAALLVDGGADVLTLKRHGGWKSTSVAEGHVNS